MENFTKVLTKEDVKNTIDMLTQSDLNRLIKELKLKGEINKEDKEINSQNDNIRELLKQKVEEINDINIIFDNFENNKLFKYGAMFKVTEEKSIDEDFFSPMKANIGTSVTNELALFESEDLFILKTVQILNGIKLSNNDENAQTLRYSSRFPIIAIVYPETSVIDIKVHTAPSILRGNNNNFYYEKINAMRTQIENQFGINLEPLEMFSVVNDIIENDIDDVKVSSQKMDFTSGANAVLSASKMEAEEILLPIIGELSKIIKDNNDLFEANESSKQIFDLLNDFIMETKDTSDLPWISLTWLNSVKTRMIQVKFLFDNYSNYDFTMLQFYNNSRGLEGMIYVAKFLINSIKEDSPGT